MSRVCKVCGCTDDRGCMTPDGPCHWVLENVCSACVIELAPGQHSGGNYGLLIEKVCYNCAHLVEDKVAGDCGYPNHWICDKGRLDDRLPSGESIPVCYALSGFRRPNKAVARAQKGCPYFEVHPRWKA